MEKFKRSRSWCIIIYLIIFGLMLLMNGLTHMTADDYTYSLNMKSNDRVSSLGEIFTSLNLHKDYANGRLIPHFFVYLFVMIPQGIFDVANSLVFTLMIFLMCHIMNTGKERNNLLPILAFIFTVLCQPAFGQQFLWIAGACNYLWCMPLALIFLLPYYNYLVYEKALSPVLWLPFFLSALGACAYSENMSAGIMFTAFSFIAISKFKFKRKLRLEQILALIIGFIGYCFMAFQQGTKDQKLSNFEPKTILLVFLVALGMVAILIVPILLYAKLLKQAKRENVAKEKLFATYILLAGGHVSNLIMLVADVYPLRCATYLVLTHLLAVGILYSSLERVSLGRHTKKLVCTTLVFTSLYLSFGIVDIVRLHAFHMEMEEIIEEGKEKGSTGIYVPLTKSISKFSAQRGHVYFSTLDPKGKKMWPNREAALYYEVDFILGYWES